MSLSNLSTQSLLKGLFFSVTFFTVLVIIIKTNNLNIDSFDKNFFLNINLKDSDSFLNKIFTNVNQVDKTQPIASSTIAKNSTGPEDISILTSTKISTDNPGKNLNSTNECSYKIANKTSKTIQAKKKLST